MSNIQLKSIMEILTKSTLMEFVALEDDPLTTDEFIDWVLADFAEVQRHGITKVALSKHENEIEALAQSQGYIITEHKWVDICIGNTAKTDLNDKSEELTTKGIAIACRANMKPKQLEFKFEM